jgi:NAD+ diphosphatase
MRFIPAVVTPARHSPRGRWFLCAENQLLLRREGGVGLEQLPQDDEVVRSGLELGPVQYLGTLDGEDALCATLDAKQPTPPGFELVGLRRLWSRLDDQLFGIAGRANQLTEFASTHQFCGRCGRRAVPHATERAFCCPVCELTSYPRISPAIITLVRRGELALLADSGRFPAPFFSTLAGFSEVGESLEQTLVREVREEVGLEATSLRYFGSQPWPFPHSLMIAFAAEAPTGDIVIDGVEIKAAAFFRADELPRIPPKLSIARQLIDAWVLEVTGRESEA